jgi:hypothetical protein
MRDVVAMHHPTTLMMNQIAQLKKKTRAPVAKGNGPAPREVTPMQISRERDREREVGSFSLKRDG